MAENTKSRLFNTFHPVLESINPPRNGINPPRNIDPSKFKLGAIGALKKQTDESTDESTIDRRKNITSTSDQQQPSQILPMSSSGRDRRQRGTGFTNISRILGANVGAGQRMGQAIGAGLGSEAQKVGSGVQAGQSKFKEGYEKSKTEAEKAIESAGSAISGETGGDYKTLGKGLKEAAYTGPSGIENIGALQSQAMNLAALGRLSGLAGGQRELLRSQVAGRGGYGIGQAALDQLLVGKYGQAGLQQARSATGKTLLETEQAEQAARSMAEAAETGIEAQKQKVYGDIYKKTGDIQEMGRKSAIDYLKKGEFVKSGLQKLSEGKLEELNPDEVSALGKMQEYGIDTTINLDPRYKEDISGILKQLSQTGAVADVGQKYYDESQKEALRRLSQLSGGEDISPEALAFDKDLFKQGKKQLEGYQDYKDIADKQKKMLESGVFKNIYGLDYTPKQMEQMFKTNKEMVERLKGKKGDVTLDLGPDKPGFRVTDAERYVADIIRNEKRYEQALEKERKAQEGKSLQDIINEQILSRKK